MTHKQKILALLADGRPHTHHELYQLGCVAHSRITDLRRDGHRIDQWRDGDYYLYQLRSLEEAQTPQQTDPPLPLGSTLHVCASSSESFNRHDSLHSRADGATPQTHTAVPDRDSLLVLFTTEERG